MTSVGLQMISLVTLLILNHQTFPFTAAAAARPSASRCIGVDELEIRTDRFRRSYLEKMPLPPPPPPPPGVMDTCVQAAGGDISARALAPWKYSLNRDVSRTPTEISFAECLCQGCIINGRENLSYNSVPVFAHVKVLKKSFCPDDRSKYVIKNDFIKVPVACTCIMPRYRKSSF
ncbi:interleukin-17C-like isoform X2 [Xiphias gladius]|uniref:interleukin-17C-like isoform X2 n=1 Tax=Xiphias gladius TaxID=8245 RepID=UPI001A993E2D|nr:interleukin-17C-like isoform X2 [Xiphias gladius]